MGVLLTAVIFFVKNDTFLCYIAWDYAFVGTRLFWGVERKTGVHLHTEHLCCPHLSVDVMGCSK